MQLLEIILIGIGLSFDTFAVSISTGLTVNTIRFWHGVKIAMILAFFQSVMPLIGWFGGVQIEEYIVNFDHWLAFGLLAILGIKMILETFKDEEEKTFNPLLLSVVIGMGLATSIDALVVGISLAFLNINIFISIAIIGFITFFVSMIGMLLGKNATGAIGKKFEIFGGIILIGIGVKILMEHLYF